MKKNDINYFQRKPLQTTVIGSYPLPGWLEFSAQNLDQFGPEDLAELQNTDAPQSNDAPAEEGGVEESNEVSLDEIAENDQQEADNSENSEQ